MRGRFARPQWRRRRPEEMSGDGIVAHAALRPDSPTRVFTRRGRPSYSYGALPSDRMSSATWKPPM